MKKVSNVLLAFGVSGLTGIIRNSLKCMVVKEALEQELNRQAAIRAFKRLRSKSIWSERYYLHLQRPKDFAHYGPLRSRLAG